ncbi:maestro heat-like repeat-containing protein family member 2B [Mauremys reevesii]|uniref:maestro heat-like repeat-containing protein family member 2B n=1 Tax=Mauremys reevesii TaxID=260615 RepID=UPI00193FC7F7|nr:maestro heat-like repeat-containing protein family member 2B [Mauremys reevesii]
MDSDTSELWRSLGGEPLLATQVLQVLIEKIKTSTSQEGSITSETETDRHLAAAEPLSATCAIFEVVSAQQSSKAVQELLPELFPVLLQQVSRTSGQKMPLPRIRSRSLFQKDQQHTEGNPCWFSVQALESVLSKAGNERLVRVLRTQKTWILLENPQTHHEGVCLLVSGLLRFGLITLEIIQSLPWLMTDPMLREKKLLKSVLRILEESSEVIGESMKALAKVLKELKEKDIGSSFKDLTQQIRTYFDDEDDALRSVAFVLFGILAQLTKKKRKAYFAEQVRKSWVTLLLHLQDPSPKVSMAKENAELLENLYSTTITYFSSSWEWIRAVAANLAGER